MMAPMVLRRSLAGALVVVAAGTLAGCSWRLEAAPEPFRTPSPITVLRDQVAAAEAAVESSARGAAGDQADAEGAAVPARLSALGGVSPTSSPRPDSVFADAVATAQSQALACMQAAESDPLGGLCASMALSHATIDAAANPSLVDATPFIVDAALTPGNGTAVTPDQLSRLALEHDQARALFEVIAARSEGAERKAALADSAAHLERVRALLAMPGVEDLTQPQYDVSASSVAGAADREATARAAQVSLADAYSALLVAAAPQDRDWLVNAAFDAYKGAIRYGLGAAAVPALPGAAQPSPSES